jgi:hypothetical protein
MPPGRRECKRDRRHLAPQRDVPVGDGAVDLAGVHQRAALQRAHHVRGHDLVQHVLRGYHGQLVVHREHAAHVADQLLGEVLLPVGGYDAHERHHRDPSSPCGGDRAGDTAGASVGSPQRGHESGRLS